MAWQREPSRDLSRIGCERGIGPSLFRFSTVQFPVSCRRQDLVAGYTSRLAKRECESEGAASPLGSLFYFPNDQVSLVVVGIKC